MIHIFSVFSAMLLVFAAARDTATRTIPNFVPVLLLVLAVGFLLISGEWLPALIAGSLVFAGMCLLWRYHLVGGGDVKLAAAFALTIPASSVAIFLLAVALAGGVLATVYIGLRLVVSRPAPGPRKSLLARALKAEAWRISHRGSIPYAVAIAAGGLVVLIPGIAPLLTR